MPVWHEATREWVKSGRLVVVGVIQEQHAQRCRLFAQWKKIDWPIVQDAINVLRPTAVPIFVAIDEHGIVRNTRPRPQRFEAEFLDREFEDDAPPADGESLTPPRDLKKLQQAAATAKTAGAWRQYADALVIWGGEERLDEAIAAYRQVVKSRGDDLDARFRLGVALRRRYETKLRQADDFSAAVAAWEAALAGRPGQYIWRRRIQQYGPRLTKPYPFYDWVKLAQADIRQRGEEPIRLTVPLTGAEVAAPQRRFASAAAGAKPPDPSGKVPRDDKSLIVSQVTVVPTRVRPGETARVHVTLVPDPKRTGHWNNESTPVQLWIEDLGGCEVSHRLLSAPNDATKAESAEPRRLDFEIRLPSAASGTVRLSAYALYNVCEEAGGKCRFLRKDLVIPIGVQERSRR